MPALLMNVECSHRIGGARVLLAGVALWSLGTLLAPPAAHMGLLALCASRVFVRAPLPRTHACINPLWSCGVVLRIVVLWQLVVGELDLCCLFA